MPAWSAESGSVSSQQTSSPSLDQVRIDAEQTAGAFFDTEDRIIVRPPVLKALVTLNQTLSPYDLDAKSSEQISLPDVLKQALANNLDIKISHADWQTSRWLYVGALGGFLPDLASGFSYQELDGKYASPFGLLTRISSPYISMPHGLQWNLFKGGSIVYGAAQARHQAAAERFRLQGTTNDILLDADSRYYDLVLNDVLLQIRVKAVETSQALLLRNQIQFENGAITKLDVLEAKSQLSRDRQALIAQQIARRQAAVKLARTLNSDSGADLIAADKLIAKVRLVDANAPITDLIQIAIDNRPELKKYEQARLAAKDAIKVAFASLMPQVYGTTGGIMTAARVTSTSRSFAGSSSAAGGSLSGGAFSTSTSTPTGLTGGARKFTPAEMFQIGLNVQWTLGGMGLTEAAKVQAAKWQARKAQLEFARQLAYVYQDVRDAYLDSLDAENQVVETTDAVNAAREQLSVATVRLDENVGTDLEVVNAQRDFTDSLINKANAIIKFNVSQAKLLRAMGKISIPTLTSIRPMAK